ncbi:MAG: hypothetical protein MRK02_12605 [Candidatus Scalindua sp.]|nr:hypothetical protein [Candidatus Scalindua sp.]
MLVIKKENPKSGLRVYYQIILTLILAVLGGCGTTSQLERVAKDWCLTIRASQVIPVYPLTEDIQPGDVFLVQTPIEAQVKVYESKGFLPFDNHLVRLQPKGYFDFYAGGYNIGTSTIPPGIGNLHKPLQQIMQTPHVRHFLHTLSQLAAVRVLIWQYRYMVYQWG